MMKIIIVREEAQFKKRENRRRGDHIEVVLEVHRWNKTKFEESRGLVGWIATRKQVQGRTGAWLGARTQSQDFFDDFENWG